MSYVFRAAVSVYMVLLDISTALDITDYDMFLSCLREEYRTMGNVTEWMKPSHRLISASRQKWNFLTKKSLGLWFSSRLKNHVYLTSTHNDAL